MLGYGYYVRPVTTIEFKPTRRRQRDHAADKGQVGRQKVFDGLLERLDQDASSKLSLTRSPT